MERIFTTQTISIYILVGIDSLTTFALVAELLPEVKAKMIVIPTLTLISGKGFCFFNFVR
jgi:hypothetical protein